MKLQPGDKVTLVVARLGDHNRAYFELKSDAKKDFASWLYVDDLVIQHHEPAPRPIQVGDMVKYKGYSSAKHAYVVKAVSIEEDAAWIKGSNDMLGTVVTLSNIEHAD